MINKRLISMVSESKKYIAGNVAVQWLSMISNMAMIFSIGIMLEKLAKKDFGSGVILTIVTAVIALLVRFVCSKLQAKCSYCSSKTVKKTLREMIYQKLLRLGSSYREQVSTSEVVQVAVEGVDQLETYFGAYLPQFFYAMLAPMTLFAVLSFISFKAAVVLLICVPIIPMAIIAVQKIPK
ncbi:MAG: ABC transporter transmembrane domain-containing protein, partial [Ruminococcus sp.]